MDLMCITIQRWCTERAYEDLKGELGLDHFEGRRFRGWHHHISIVLCCYAFLVSERVRHFPPRPQGLWPTKRTATGPERHVIDTIIIVRLGLARAVARWLPRCPTCRDIHPCPSVAAPVTPTQPVTQ